MFRTRGLLVSFEGIDGCGKSTQVEMLRHMLTDNAIEFTAVREPGGTAVGENIRQVLLDRQYSPSMQAELLLYMAARSELTAQVIMPALHNGIVVLCDRYTDSTLAYQGYGGGVDLNYIRFLNKMVTGGIAPHLTFLLDLSAEEAAMRRGASADRMESKDTCFHQRVRRGYLELARLEPGRIIVVDASDGIEELGEKVWRIVHKLIAERSSARFVYEL